MFGVTGPSAGVLSTMTTDGEANAENVFAFRPIFGSKESSDSVFRDINDRNHIIDLDLNSPHDVEVSSDGSMLFVAQMQAPYLRKIDIIKSGG